MTNNKKSSVELFAIALYEGGYLQGNGDEINDLLERHKAMHKEEIMDASIDGMYKGQDIYFSEGKVKLDVNSLNCCIGIAEDHYNETYGGKK